MLQIYICEDDQIFREFILKELEKYIIINAIGMKIQLSTDSPFDLIKYIKDTRTRSIYILDVDIKNETYDGFTLAKKIRELDPRGFIIFIASHEELTHMIFKYRVEAMDYIIKGEDDIGRLIECIDSVQKRLNDDKFDNYGYYTFESFNEIYNIPVKNIIYFETSIFSKHKIIIHTVSEDIEYIDRLKNVEKKIGDEFLRLHRSYLVNKSAIKSISLSENIVELVDGSICPIARSVKNKIKNMVK